MSKTRYCCTPSSTASSWRGLSTSTAMLPTLLHLALAEQQKATAPIMIGHRLLGTTCLLLGDAAEALSHLDRAWALYDPAVHRPLATRFGHDVGAATLIFRPLALWLLGYPKTALLEADRALDVVAKQITSQRFFLHYPALRSLVSAAGITRRQPRTLRSASLWRRRRFRS